MVAIIVPVAVASALPQPKPAIAVKQASIPLDTALERQLYLSQEPAINSLTWYRLAVDNKKDGAAAAAAIEQLQTKMKLRMKHIFQKNPWLRGKIQAPTLRLFGVPKLVFDDTEYDDDDDLPFAVAQVDARVSPSMPIQQVYGAVSAHTCLPSKSPPLWKVTWIQPSTQHDDNDADLAVKTDSVCFGLLCSLSHQVGDANVFYKLQAMILKDHDKTVDANDDKDAIVSLKVDFDGPSLDAQVTEALGQDSMRFLQGPMLVGGMLGILDDALSMRSSLGTGEQWYKVDNDAILALKEKIEKASPTPMRVSTNDCLCAWFFGALESNLGVICVDFRQRLSGCEAHHGRNPWGSIIYRPDDYSPTAIRASLASLKRVSGAALPSIWQTASYRKPIRYAITTSWTNRPSLELAGCEMITHFPVLDFASFLPSGFAVMRTFKATDDNVGVYIAGNKNVLNNLDLPPLLKQVESAADFVK